MTKNTISTVLLLTALTGCRACFPFGTPDAGELDSGTTEPTTDAGETPTEPADAGIVVEIEDSGFHFLDAGLEAEAPSEFPLTER